MVDVLDTPPMFHDKLPYDAYCAAMFAEEDIKIPKTFEEAMKSPYCNHWSAAMVSELLQFNHHGVFQEVKWHKGIWVLGTIWVYSIKRNANSKIICFKARLVAQGFDQRPGIDYHDTYALVACSLTILFLIALAAAQGLYLEQFNFDCTLLNGKMTEDVYVRYPKGWNCPQSPGKCLKLHRAVNDLMVSRGFIRATANACLYIKHLGTSLAIITLYVDNGLIMSNNQSFLDSKLALLHKAFQLKHYILVHQSKYVRTMLEKFDFASPSKRRAVTPMDNCPSLRIDATPFANVSLYQSANSCPTLDNWAAVKRIFRYLNSTIDLGIIYQNSSTTQLMVYSDALFADDPESRRLVGAYASMLAGGVISWQSKQQSMIATSTTEAEILSASSATREAIWLRRLAGDVGIPQAQPTIIQEDNAACIQIAKDPVNHMQTKHFDIAHLFIREQVASGKVELEYCPTHINAVDIMTKPLGFQRFDQLCALLRMVSLVSLTGGSVRILVATNGGAQFGHGKLGLIEPAETREDLANWPNWSIWDIVTRLWNCIAASARDKFAHVRRKGKATGRNGDDGQTLAKVKVGYIFRAAMVLTVQDLMKTVKQALDKHKKETCGEVESELATMRSNPSRSKCPAGATGAGCSVAKKRAKFTDDATLQQLASATPDQINKTIATPLAKKHGRGNLPKHASPKTVATQPVSKTLGRLRVPTSDTEYYGQSH
ncbi:BQ5605_C051g12550 [Microbotryum silenes-dioicae]|uniref:BQ5605_C051g12550 protein n=1 Tax=Microbotryum silenes-dioicae TaxID=796604 RepID=A0A2X0MNY2_9BASI|nr:BQ5605_C051g12550 [Microbotryum silenes-dioicae]